MSSPPAPTPSDVTLSEYAVKQYCERLRPGLDIGPARIELARLLPNGEIVSEPPAWVRAASTKPYYLVIGNAIALPLGRQDDGWIATTCITQTTLTDRGREQRARHKASRSSRRRAERRARW